METETSSDAGSIQSDWTEAGIRHGSCGHVPPEDIQERIIRVTADEGEVKGFFDISFSPDRSSALTRFYQDELADLENCSFECYNQQERADYILLKKYFQRELRRLELKQSKDADIVTLLPFTSELIKLYQARQHIQTQDLKPRDIADAFTNAARHVKLAQAAIERGTLKCNKMSAFRAVRAVRELRGRLNELYDFFRGYDPLFDWWVTEPYMALVQVLDSLVSVIEVNLVGVSPGDQDAIIGDAIGREGLLAELDAEVIPYTPEELLAIARQKYSWCEAEMKKAACELGFGDDWKAGLEHVKNLHVEPGGQVTLIKELVDEGAAYIKAHDLVTVPALAEKTWRMFMMSPAAQKANPFFLGGDSIIVSYPTAAMSHADKLMSMRGNSRPLARATAFHEMVPGHRLQLFMSARHRPYRGRLFSTPFYVEGWAMYWELVLWERGDFFTTPADRIGTLFWRMHRCARIIFSLGFHLGHMTPDECVDLLVDMVGHERATAEGEVRRSLRGDYSPLYQAGYMLGALQLYELRSEVLASGVCSEKEFHDQVLRAGEMPIEILRALLLGKTLRRDYHAAWKFCGEPSTAFLSRYFS